MIFIPGTWRYRIKTKYYLFIIIIIIGNISKPTSQNQLCIQINSEQLVSCDCNENIWTRYVTHLDETSHMSAEFVFRYGPKCMGGLILPILVLLHL